MTDPRWLALALTPGVGPRRLLRVLSAGDPEPPTVARVLGAELAAAYQQVRAAREAERLIEAARAQGARVTGPWDPAYPAGLRHLADPPAPLFLQGEVPAWERAVAVIGTRAASPWASRLARELGQALAEAGVAVVSGLARGIDAAAHKGALAAGGVSVAVLGSALDKIYPPEHAGLAKGSVLVSEFAFGTGPRPEHFPRRNRLIAALSRVVVVVEAPERSGALITARYALELGREVLAVPGRPTDVKSRGPNRLIQDGAPPVIEPADVLSALGITPHKAAPAPTLSADLERLYAALKEKGEALPDDLAAELGLSAGELLARLTELELLGLAEGLPGGRYQAL